MGRLGETHLRVPRPGHQIGKHHTSTDPEDPRARPSTLPDGLQARPAIGGDLEGVVALCRRCDVADLGEPDTETDDVLAAWRRRGFELARDTVLVLTGAGEMIGPSLWFLAVAGEELVGANLCFAGSIGGYVAQLAVRRDRRGRGLGLALLRHGFAELYRRGERQVWLHVDTENRTGATRLYELAGMRVAHRFDCWLKRLG